MIAFLCFGFATCHRIPTVVGRLFLQSELRNTGVTSFRCLVSSLSSIWFHQHVSSHRQQIRPLANVVWLSQDDPRPGKTRRERHDNARGWASSSESRVGEICPFAPNTVEEDRVAVACLVRPSTDGWSDLEQGADRGPCRRIVQSEVLVLNDAQQCSTEVNFSLNLASSNCVI